MVMMDGWWCLPTREKIRARARRDGSAEGDALATMLAEILVEAAGRVKELIELGLVIAETVREARLKDEG